MGSAFKDLGKLDQSIELYKKAITFKPNYVKPIVIWEML